MEMYFIIINSDGETSVDSVTKEELLKRINNEWYGSDPSFFEKLNFDKDTNYWGDNILIIKGNLVSPKVKTTITEFIIE